MEKRNDGRTVRPIRLMATSMAFLSTAWPLRSVGCGGGWRAGNGHCVRCLGGCRKGGGAAGESGEGMGERRDHLYCGEGHRKGVRRRRWRERIMYTGCGLRKMINAHLGHIGCWWAVEGAIVTPKVHQPGLILQNCLRFSGPLFTQASRTSRAH